MYFSKFFCLLVLVRGGLASGGFGEPRAYDPYHPTAPWPPLYPVPNYLEGKFTDIFTFTPSELDKGGCTADQKRKLNDAFNEALYLAWLLYDYVSSELQGVTPIHHVGDFLWEIFGIHPSYYIAGGGGSYDAPGANPVTDRPQHEVWRLQYMRGLMVLIAKHSRGELPWTHAQTIKTTRLYCNWTWLKEEEYQRDNNGLQTKIKLQNGPMYYDEKSNIFSPIPWGGKFVQDKGLCGPVGQDPDDTDAFTSPLVNAITFCPEIWKPAHPVRMPIAAADPERIPPQPIDYFDSISWAFFHEYTHLVGYSMFGDQGVIDQINDLGNEGYGFPAASKLSTSNKAVTNADSYVLLSVACWITKYDWSDGFCRNVVE